MTREEAEQVLRNTSYWHYPFELPWGRMRVGKPQHDERHALRRQHFFEPLLKLYGGSLAGKTVLDLGCCQGFWSFEALRADAAHCVGLDSSPQFIREAEAIRTLSGANRCDFRVAHLDEPGWGEGVAAVNVTLFLGLFYHLSDPLYGLRQAMALTTETIVVDTAVTPREEPVLAFRRRDPDEPTTKGSEPLSGLCLLPSPTGLRWLLEDGGFRTVRFLTPAPSMPAQYLAGGRATAIAQRK
jgi:SAM-dependent methyltransferase